MSQTVAETTTADLNNNNKPTKSVEELLNNLTLNDQTSSLIEKIYDSIRRNEDLDSYDTFFQQGQHLKLNININEMLKNGDTLLCLCCNKGLDNLVKTLVEKCNANLNLSRSINCTSTGGPNSGSFSTTYLLSTSLKAYPFALLISFQFLRKKNTSAIWTIAGIEYTPLGCLTFLYCQPSPTSICI